MVEGMDLNEILDDSSTSRQNCWVSSGLSTEPRKAEGAGTPGGKQWSTVLGGGLLPGALLFIFTIFVLEPQLLRGG